MQHEEWRTVEGLPNYQVSNLGNARSYIRGKPRILKPRLSKGYYSFHGWADGKEKNIRLHRAVCIAFHGLPPSESHVAAHNDGNPLNNNANNLRWATPTENVHDRVKHGRPYTGSDNPNATLTPQDVLRILESADSLSKLAKKFGVSKTQISRIRRGRSWGVDVTTLREEAERMAA